MHGGFKISAIVAAGVAGLLVVAILLHQPPYVYAQVAAGVAGYQWPVQLGSDSRGGVGMYRMHHGGWRRVPLLNFTVSTEELQLSGRLVELDRGYMVVETLTGRVVVKTPMWLLVDNESVSLVRLAFENKLNIGDEVQLVVYRVTVARQDGTQSSFYILKELVDLTTGLQATRLHFRQGGTFCETSYTGNA